MVVLTLGATACSQAVKGQGPALLLRRLRSSGTQVIGQCHPAAVSLIIPMLAALAAYYQSADRDAPRIILMDEAFVGIDNEMRAKFMDLMVQVDLDFRVYRVFSGWV